MSNIQALFLPKLMHQNGNIALVGETGTGKSLALAIAAVHHADVTKKTPNVIVVCATYEAAIQMSNVIQQVAIHTSIKIGLAVQNLTGIKLIVFQS